MKNNIMFQNIPDWIFIDEYDNKFIFDFLKKEKIVMLDDSSYIADIDSVIHKFEVKITASALPEYFNTFGIHKKFVKATRKSRYMINCFDGEDLSFKDNDCIEEFENVEYTNFELEIDNKGENTYTLTFVLDKLIKLEEEEKE